MVPVFFVVVQRWLAGDREAAAEPVREVYGPPAPCDSNDRSNDVMPAFAGNDAMLLVYLPSGLRIFTSSAWTNSLPQITWPVLSGSSSPSMPLTTPPASRTMICAGRHVPRLQIALPIAVEAAGGDKGHVERGRAEPAKPGDPVLDFGHFPARQIVIAASDMRQAAGDHAFIELAAAGDAQPLLVEEGALAALGDVELVIGGIVDHARDDRAFALQADRDRELRNAVQEIRGAVERIDDPGVALVGAFARCRLPRR